MVTNYKLLRNNILTLHHNFEFEFCKFGMESLKNYTIFVNIVCYLTYIKLDLPCFNIKFELSAIKTIYLIIYTVFPEIRALGSYF